MQDSRGGSKDISSLASFSEWNQSRDFWRWVNLPLDTCTEISILVSSKHSHLDGDHPRHGYQFNEMDEGRSPKKMPSH